VDFDIQGHLALGKRQDLMIGGGYRNTSDSTIGTIDQGFVPADFRGSLVNLFVQDEIILKPERVALYAGTKLENNYFSGYDLQPSLRLAWTPNSKDTFWAAISRSSRTPTRRDIGLLAALAAFPGPELVQLQGNANFGSEHLISYEAGYRTQPSKEFSFAIATFINSYSSLESIEVLPPYQDNSFNPPVTVLPRELGNRMHGMTEGVEAYANWKVTSRWTLSPSYSFLEMHLHTDANSTDTVSVADTQGSSPSHQAQLRSHVELLKQLSWDVNTYFVERLPAQAVPSYTRMDAQLMWKFWEHGTFSVVGQNLLRDHHFEFNDYLQEVNSSQVKRGVYAKLTWEF
jgi:iron complex outermembrane receptor protein